MPGICAAVKATIRKAGCPESKHMKVAAGRAHDENALGGGRYLEGF
jgi:hypothetical protein